MDAIVLALKPVAVTAAWMFGWLAALLLLAL
jgi:hypothetical protein